MLNIKSTQKQWYKPSKEHLNRTNTETGPHCIYVVTVVITDQVLNVDRMPRTIFYHECVRVFTLVSDISFLNQPFNMLPYQIFFCILNHGKYLLVLALSSSSVRSMILRSAFGLFGGYAAGSFDCCLFS